MTFVLGMVTVEYLLTALIVVLAPGTGVIYTPVVRSVFRNPWRAAGGVRMHARYGASSFGQCSWARGSPVR